MTNLAEPIMHTDKQHEFRAWVMGHSDILYNYALKRVPDEHTARDIVQETFLAAWRNMAGFKGTASVKNWLFVILKSKLSDHYRRHINIQSIASDHKDHTYFDTEGHWNEPSYPTNWSVDFEDRAAAKEFYLVFKSCGRKLKEVQHAAFIMKYVDGLESEEICAELGISAANYWVLIHRAKVQLRACLQKNWIGK
jgi:RNA polymerase sigma-70 factor (TIGR02943 family)